MKLFPVDDLQIYVQRLGYSIMARNEKTSKKVASKASKLLRDPKSGNSVKSVAGSALTQAPNRKRKK